MPFSEKAHRLFEGIAHGWTPSDPKLQHLTQGKAKELAAEGVKSAESEGQKRALRNMKGRQS
jgi:hypothetical protein